MVCFCLSSGLQCNKPDHCAETEWHAGYCAPHKLKESQPAEDHTGFGWKFDQEPKPASSSW